MKNYQFLFILSALWYIAGVYWLASLLAVLAGVFLYNHIKEEGL